MPAGNAPAGVATEVMQQVWGDCEACPGSRYTAAMTTSIDTPVNRPDITIFHNNRCSNSRGALALLREHGIEPNIVDYIATPLTAPELAELVAHLGVPVRELLRSRKRSSRSWGWTTRPSAMWS